jgi:anti-anti-sigma factor
MTDTRRNSRADRRRRAGTYEGGERRKPAPATMTMYSQTRDNELQIYVQSPITADNAPLAKETLAKHVERSKATRTVVVDLYKTTYIDTPGLSILYELKQELAAKGRSLILQNPSRCVLRMLNITRMYRIFPYRNTSTDVEVIPSAKSGTPPPPENLNVRAEAEKND